MQNKITVIVVNPKSETVESKEIVVEDIAKEVGNTPLTAIEFQDHVMFLDDNGLLRENQNHFKIEYEDVLEKYIFNESFTGNGVITKIDDEGFSISATLTAEDVEQNITWI